MFRKQLLLLILIFNIQAKEIIPIITSISKLIEIFHEELQENFKSKNFQIYLLSHKIFNTNNKRKDKFIFYCKNDKNIFYLGLEVEISMENFENKESIKNYVFSQNLSKVINFFDLKLTDLNFIQSSENYTNDYLNYMDKNKSEEVQEFSIYKNAKNFSNNNRMLNSNKIQHKSNKISERKSKYLQSNINAENSEFFNRNKNENKNEIFDTLKEIKNISLKNNYDNYVSVTPNNQNKEHTNENFKNSKKETQKTKSSINDYFRNFF